MLPVSRVLCYWQLGIHMNRLPGIKFSCEASLALSKSVRDGGRWPLKTAQNKAVLVTWIWLLGSWNALSKFLEVSLWCLQGFLHKKSVILLIYQSILWAKVISNKLNFFHVLHLMSAHYKKIKNQKGLLFIISTMSTLLNITLFILFSNYFYHQSDRGFKSLSKPTFSSLSFSTWVSETVPSAIRNSAGVVSLLTVLSLTAACSY